MDDRFANDPAADARRRGRAMTNPLINPQLLDAIRDELAGVYSNSGIEDLKPSPEEAIRSALVEVATDLRREADEQGECNKVDECAAGVLVRYRLADWLSQLVDELSDGGAA
jgi:hypothetical protein